MKKEGISWPYNILYRAKQVELAGNLSLLHCLLQRRQIHTAMQELTYLAAKG